MDLLDQRKVKTRKPHICHGCQQLIPANTVDVDFQTIADDGRMYSNYTCQKCITWTDRNPDYFDEPYFEGDIREAMIYMGEWVEPLPQATATTESAK